MKRAFTLIEVMIVVAIISIIAAILMPVIIDRKRVPLTAAQIHIGDEVRIAGNVRHGRVVEIRPDRNDGEPARIMVRIRDDHNAYTITEFFPQELSAP